MSRSQSEIQDEQKREFAKKVGPKAERKKKARQQQDRSVWFGLGAMGVVGWTVGLFTLAGVLLGLWLDATWPSRVSWTLTLLVGGLLAGCLAAAFWVMEEWQAIRRDRNGGEQ